ncbi:hypothetical protein CDD83_5642 [Cordyceps sp. RAO-2017]|nr:hypothetical protein CDD83_5642 [Cordyceps sp. RAO-2017]
MEPPPDTVVIPADQADARSDDEIAAWLQTRHPIRSERNVWAFWHSGFRHMAPWVQRNVIGWVRRLGPSWTVHVLDLVPGSDTNVHNYLEQDFFPDAFNNGTMDGPHTGPHRADLMKLPLLWKYGGVWMDAGIILFRSLDDMFWTRLEDPDCPHEIAGLYASFRPNEQLMINSLIAAKRRNPFILCWHDTYKALWAGGATNSHNFHKHPLFRHRPPLAAIAPLEPDREEYGSREARVEALNDYLGQTMVMEALCRAEEDSWSEYYARHVYLLPSTRDMFYLQAATGWCGERQHRLLSAKRRRSDTAPDETWREAEALVVQILSRASTLKLPHHHGLVKTQLADIWDRDENREADIAEGSFAEYLRYGSVHFVQSRDVKPASHRNSL